MECHDALQLLAFVNRPNEELDAAERAALREHLEKCPDCGARLNAERRGDDVLAAVMRDVPVPGDLKAKVLKRLTAERGEASWRSIKRVSMAAAAVILIGATASVAWIVWPLPKITRDYLIQEIVPDNWSKEQVEEYFKEQGLLIQAPTDFNYQWLQQAEVVEFKGRRVAKLTFSRTDDKAAIAQVLIISSKQFRTNEIDSNEEIAGTTRIRIHHNPNFDEFTYLIFYRGNLDGVLHRTF